MAEGKPVRDPAGKAVNIHADHLEVSPDGRWFYYQPANGQLARIETRFLDDPDVSETIRAAKVTSFAATPSTGGTAMAADGTIYLSDAEHSAILSISPEGKIDTVITDARLAWVDAMWIDDAGRLLLPASQLSRTAGLNGGKDAVERPINLYALDIGAKPLRR
jgi:sugar lactone lactonase YvrE